MANIRQYIAWCEQRIGVLVVNEGLHCSLLSVVQGPLTLTFKARPLQPSPLTMRKLLGMGPAIAAAIQVESVRISLNTGTILIESPSPIRRTPRASELAQHTRGLTVAVGYNTNRQPAYVDLQQHGALFWIGPSRKGKTQNMKSTLYALIKRNGSRLRYAILCHERKLADWQAFEPAVGCLGIVSDPGEQVQVLTWAAGDLMVQRPPFTFVIIVDDLLNLLGKAPDLAESLAEVASIGAGLGVHLLAGTQEAGSRRGTGGAGVENNATARILYRNSSAAAARAAGQGGVGIDQLSGAKGDALLLLDGQSERIATGLADDRLILQLPAGEHWIAPWRPERSAEKSERTRTSQNDRERAVLLPYGRTPADVVEGGTAEQVIERLVQNGHKLPGNRPPTAVERAYLRALYAEFGSKEKVYPVAWGFKNGVVQKYLTAAIEEQPASSKDAPNTAQRDGTENLNDPHTDQDQTVLEQLKRKSCCAGPTGNWSHDS